MNKEEIKQFIEIINKSIKEVEPKLTKEEFQDYCDSTTTIITYWETILKSK